MYNQSFTFELLVGSPIMTGSKLMFNYTTSSLYSDNKIRYSNDFLYRVTSKSCPIDNSAFAIASSIGFSSSSISFSNPTVNETSSIIFDFIPVEEIKPSDTLTLVLPNFLIQHDRKDLPYQDV